MICGEIWFYIVVYVIFWENNCGREWSGFDGEVTHVQWDDVGQGERDWKMDES